MNGSRNFKLLDEAASPITSNREARPLARTVNDDSKPARRRLAAIKRIRKILQAGLHMGPDGLQLARAKAAGKL